MASCPINKKPIISHFYYQPQKSKVKNISQLNNVWLTVLKTIMLKPKKVCLSHYLLNC